MAFEKIVPSDSEAKDDRLATPEELDLAHRIIQAKGDPEHKLVLSADDLKRLEKVKHILEGREMEWDKYAQYVNEVRKDNDLRHN